MKQSWVYIGRNRDIVCDDIEVILDAMRLGYTVERKNRKGTDYFPIVINDFQSQNALTAFEYVYRIRFSI